MPKAKKGHGRGSSTPGKAKGENCHRSPLKNLYAKDTRLYKKNPVLFLRACEVVSGMKGNNPTAEVIAKRNGEVLG